MLSNNIVDGESINIKSDVSTQKESEIKLPVALRIINLLFILPSLDESESSEEKNKEENKCHYTITTTLDKDRGEKEKVEERSAVLVQDMVGQTKEDVSKKDASTQTEQFEDTESPKSKTDLKQSTDKGSSGKALEQKDQEKQVQEMTEIEKIALVDNSVKPKKVEKSTEDKSKAHQFGDLYEDETFFGPLYNYDFDSWDFGIPNTLICPDNGKNLYLLILIHSRVKNFDQRQAIRDTWGRLARMEGISYAFILEIATDNRLDNQLKHESDKHNDIILTDLADLSANDAALSVMSFKWLMYYCPRVKYVFKTNDDVFVNLPQLSILLKDKTTKDTVMYGYRYQGYPPERNPRKENYVTKKEFPGDVYPDYLAPEGYIFPGKFAPDLFKTALTMRYMPIENIFVTGILANELGIHRDDVPLFSATFPDLPKQDKCNILSYIIVFHPLSPRGMRYFWDILKRTGFKCGYFMEGAGKMIPKDSRMYSNNNEKILYAILTGETNGKIDYPTDSTEEIRLLKDEKHVETPENEKNKTIPEKSTPEKNNVTSEKHIDNPINDKKLPEKSITGDKKSTEKQTETPENGNDKKILRESTPADENATAEKHVENPVNENNKKPLEKSTTDDKNGKQLTLEESKKDKGGFEPPLVFPKGKEGNVIL